MSPRLPRLTAKQLIKKLKEHGYTLHASGGSHQHFIHPEKPGKVTIPVHSGKIIVNSGDTIHNSLPVRTGEW